MTEQEIEKNKKKIVSLGSDVGLIIPMQTGVLFTNQVNGVCCSHPELEGIFVPLSAYSDDNLKDIEAEYPKAEFIKDWIKQHKLPLKLLEEEWFEGLGRHSHNPEAWINVKILTHENLEFSPLKDFVGMEAILTYENSD